jgi:hypothetical protein
VPKLSQFQQVSQRVSRLGCQQWVFLSPLVRKYPAGGSIFAFTYFCIWRFGEVRLVRYLKIYRTEPTTFRGSTGTKSNHNRTYRTYSSIDRIRDTYRTASQQKCLVRGDGIFPGDSGRSFINALKAAPTEQSEQTQHRINAQAISNKKCDHSDEIEQEKWVILALSNKGSLPICSSH